MRHAPAGDKQTHSCSNDPLEKDKIIKQIRKLMSELEHVPCMPRPPVAPNLKFLEKKQPRFVSDPDSVPTITHVPLLELRPTSEYKKLTKNKSQLNNVIYIDVPPAQSTHASPPWALPAQATVMKEEELLPCPTSVKNCVCCPQAKSNWNTNG